MCCHILATLCWLHPSVGLLFWDYRCSIHLVPLWCHRANLINHKVVNFKYPQNFSSICQTDKRFAQKAPPPSVPITSSSRFYDQSTVVVNWYWQHPNNCPPPSLIVTLDTTQPHPRTNECILWGLILFSWIVQMYKIHFSVRKLAGLKQTENLGWMGIFSFLVDEFPHCSWCHNPFPLDLVLVLDLYRWQLQTESRYQKVQQEWILRYVVNIYVPDHMIINEA